MRTFLCAELKSRDTVLARERLTIVRALNTGIAASTAALHPLFRQGETIYADLSRLFARLDEFVVLQQSLESKAAFVENLTRELRLAAMNASLASSRMGSDGMSLSVVALHMDTTSTQVAHAVGILDEDIGQTSVRLKSVVFNLAVGRLQIEMILTFLRELASREPAVGQSPATLRSVHVLLRALRHSLERAGAALGELGQSNRRLNATAESLERHMLELQVAQVSGVVEATRARESASFDGVFGQIRELIQRAHGQLAELEDVLGRLDAIAEETPATARALTTSAQEMETRARALVAAAA
jgi:aerotaxis receptor